MPNLERSEKTRNALIAAARNLFIQRGYAAAGTPEIVASAGLTRGALYHHFADKRALFAAVVEQEAAAIAAEVEAAGSSPEPIQALLDGARAYLMAISEPGRARLLLTEGPSVLSREELRDLEDRHGGRTLQEGIKIAMDTGVLQSLPLPPLVRAFSAAWDRAALEVVSGSDPEDELKVFQALLMGLKQGR